MKLLRLEIASFGKFYNYKYDFKDGLNEIFGENGAGKTTFVAFITAMFYGLENVTAKTVAFTNRVHFKPFNGGIFGGSLTFEYAGDEYRIEREFADKIKDDKFTLYKNNNLSKDFSNNIGEELFGLSLDSFNKFLILTSHNVTLDAGADVTAKLSNLTSTEVETFDLNDILDKVNKKIVKKRELEELNQKQRDLEIEIKNLEEVKTNLSFQEEKLLKLKNELDSVNKTLKEINELETLKQKWATYDEKKRTVTILNEELLSTKEGLNGPVPEVEDVETLRGLENQINDLKIKKESLKLSDSEVQNLNELTDQFGDIDNIKLQITKVQGDISSHHLLCEKINELNNDLNSFSERPEFSNTEKVQNDLEHLKRLKEKYQNAVNSPVIHLEKSNVTSVLSIILIVLFFICLGLGIGLIFKFKTVGIILLACSAAFFLFSIISIIFSLVSKLNKAPQQQESPLVQAYFEEIKDILNNYNIELKDVYEDISLLERTYNDYQASLMKNEELNEILNEKINKRKNLETSLNDFFEGFGLASNNQNYLELINTLNSSITTYENLKKRSNDIQVESKQVEENLILLTNNLSKFYQEKEIDEKISSDLLRLKLDKINDLRIKIETAKKDQDSYFNDNNLSIEPDYQLLNSKESLESRQRELNQEIASIEQTIDSDTLETNNLDALSDKLEETKEKIFTTNHQNKIYESLSEYLKKTETDIKNNYQLPIKTNFLSYEDLIKNTTGTSIILNDNYELSYEKAGKIRKINHLSDGEFAVAAMCYRFAIIDSLYQKDWPFIIFDDPFVAVDDKQMKQVLSCVKELSSSRQIVYFTCSSSRTISKE